MAEEDAQELQSIPLETTLSEQFELLKEMNISLNNFEKSGAFSDKVTVGLSQAISDAFFGVKEIEDKHEKVLNMPEIKSMDKTRNVFYKMYTERGEAMKQLKLANAYRMWWVKFVKEHTKKLQDLLLRVRDDYDAVAKLKAEKDLFEVRSKKETEFAQDLIEEIEEKHALEIKLYKQMLDDAKKDNRRLLDIVAGAYKTGKSQQVASEPEEEEESEHETSEESVEPEVEESPSTRAREKYSLDEIKADKKKQMEVLEDEIKSGERSMTKLIEYIALKHHPLAKTKLNRLIKMLKYDGKIDESIELLEDVKKVG